MCACVAWVLVSRFPCGGFKVLVWSCSVPPEPPFPRPPFPGPPFPGPPFPGPPFLWTPFPWTAQNFALFFFPVPPQNSFFSSLSGCLLVEFWWCFEDRDPQMCTFGLSGCRVKPRRLRGRRGFTRQPENSKRAHLSAPALQTQPKFHEKTPREGRKEQILRRDREKKARNFGRPTLRPPTIRAPTIRAPTIRHSAPSLRAPTLRAPTLRSPTLRAPTLRGPTFSGLGPPPFEPPTLRTSTFLHPPTST